ncbi:hypothetical protein BDW66DRAFT_50840 [Aspergillus desertorum]
MPQVLACRKPSLPLAKLPSVLLRVSFARIPQLTLPSTPVPLQLHASCGCVDAILINSLSTSPARLVCHFSGAAKSLVSLATRNIKSTTEINYSMFYLPSHGRRVYHASRLVLGVFAAGKCFMVG